MCLAVRVFLSEKVMALSTFKLLISSLVECLGHAFDLLVHNCRVVVGYTKFLVRAKL